MAATSPSPAPSPSPDAATIIRRSQSAWQGLTSYQVPVTVSAHVRVAIISLPVRMTGTQYYQAPDRQALHLDNPPSFARGLGDTLSTMGTPQTWLQDYTIVTPVLEPRKRHTAYVLTGTPKRPSRVKTMTLEFSTTTYAIENVNFAYTNGATLQVAFQHHHVSQYHLPLVATVTAKFPSYSGDATITYGTYQLNQPIPASIFTQH
jgi:hypothetical protein